MVDTFGCRGNTIKVHAGHYLDLADPSIHDIDLATIAAALSKLCRFGCHCPKFYSVAEHCVHASRLAAKDQYGIEAQRAILLHDAAEAYIGDVVKPLKLMLPDYAEVEERMERVVGKRFGVGFESHAGVIKLYDQAMLKAEKQAMWPEDAEEWTGFGGIADVDVTFEFWSPSDAEERFLFLAGCLSIT